MRFSEWATNPRTVAMFKREKQLLEELEWARSCLTAIDQDYVSAEAMRKCAKRGLKPRPERLGVTQPASL